MIGLITTQKEQVQSRISGAGNWPRRGWVTTQRAGQPLGVNSVCPTSHSRYATLSQLQQRTVKLPCCG